MSRSRYDISIQANHAYAVLSRQIVCHVGMPSSGYKILFFPFWNLINSHLLDGCGMELERMLLPKTPNSAEESIPNQLGPLIPNPLTFWLITSQTITSGARCYLLLLLVCNCLYLVQEPWKNISNFHLNMLKKSGMEENLNDSKVQAEEYWSRHVWISYANLKIQFKKLKHNPALTTFTSQICNR